MQMQYLGCRSDQIMRPPTGRPGPATTRDREADLDGLPWAGGVLSLDDCP